MGSRVDVVRMSWSDATVAHCRYPPWEAREGALAAAPGSIALGYNGQAGVVLQDAGGRAFTRDLPRGSIRLNAAEPMYWLRAGAADVVEVTASPALRAEIAGELGVSTARDLDDIHGWYDRLAWTMLSRFRAALRGGPPLTELERDQLVRALYARAYQSHYAAATPDRAAARHGLDTRRLAMVLDHVDAHLGEPLTISALADAAAFSPFHFARSFKRATGYAPHQFVTLRRIERARALLLDSSGSVESIASAVGFANRGHFRRLFAAHTGMLPAAFRAAAK
ncbi:MAG TPA: AraC family transcriptional regulator [Mycobacterium sp.]|nr:AraC family transcriptional regulator [Mycobacterium sp.]